MAKEASRRRVYLVRHAEVDYFDSVGRPLLTESVPLSPAGVRQAEALRELFAPTRVDRVVTSGLLRTRQTAEILVGGREVSWEVCEALQEIRPGNLSAVPPALLPKALAEALPRDANGPSRFLGGEEFRGFAARVTTAFEALVAEVGWQELLIVAHGGVNRAILLHLFGVGASRFAALEQDPGAVNIVDWDERHGPVVRLLNYTPYAPLKRGLVRTTLEELAAQAANRVENGTRD